MSLLFLLVAIYAVVFVVRTLGSKDTGVKGTPVTAVLKESFPEIDVPDIDDSEYLVNEDSGKVKIRRCTGSLPKENAVPAPAVENEKEQAAEPAKSKGDFSLKSRSEAKRAFVYSEIFNRKY